MNNETNKNIVVNITQYKWEGSFGPFKINIPCGECTISMDIIKDVIHSEFNDDLRIEYIILPWLTYWWRPLLRGGWHAPITIVNGKVIDQGKAVDRGLLAYYIRKNLVKDTRKQESVIYSKDGCGFCDKAKTLLKENNVVFVEKNVVKDPLFTQELFHLTKQFFPKNKPVTTPQIWLDGEYVGGYEELKKYFDEKNK